MNKRKVIICAVSLFLVSIVVLLSALGFIWCKISKVNPYITDKQIVYVPESVPRKFHYDLVGFFFGNDGFEYWVIKPNKADKEALLEDVQNGNWSDFNGQYNDILFGLNYYGNEFTKPVISKQLNSEGTYICYYDDVKEEVVNEFDSSFITSQWIIFIYDSEANIYYCIHQSC